MKYQHVIDQLIQEQEWKKRWKSNYIEFDDYFKYSGEVEPDCKEYSVYLQELHENKNFISYYKKRIRGKNFFLFLNEEESKIIDYFYRHSDKTLVEIAEDVGHSKTYVSKIIGKHIKIQQDDKKNTG